MNINPFVEGFTLGSPQSFAIVYLANFVANLVFFTLVGTILNCKINKKLASLLGSAIIAIVPMFSLYYENEPATYIISCLIGYVIISIIYKSTTTQSLFLSVLSCFFTICTTGISIGIFSLVAEKNMYQIISIPLLRVTVLGISALFKTCFFLYCIDIFSQGKGKTFLNSTRELKDVLYVHLCIMLFVLFYSYNYYYNLDLIWFSLAQIFMGIIMIAIYLTTLSYGKRVATLIEVDIRNKNITKQMEEQLTQYNSYQKLSKNISDFKHKYGEFLLTAEYLIEKKDLQKLSTMFKAQEKDMEKIIMSVRDFSNDAICNSVLFSLHSRCIANNITFDATIYVPENSNPTSETIRILLYQLSQFALSLINIMPQNSQNKQISLNSHTANNWLTIKMENSYTGKINIKNGQPEFIMANSTDIKTEYDHIKDLIEQKEGIISLTVDPKQKTLTTSISFNNN